MNHVCVAQVKGMTDYYKNPTVVTSDPKSHKLVLYGHFSLTTVCVNSK